MLQVMQELIGQIPVKMINRESFHSDYSNDINKLSISLFAISLYLIGVFTYRSLHV